ncbi:sugar ABC transporter permease [Pseudonocardia sp. EV170527-09]|uniref:sugar ABC transporter permease n=1 Tax=Pseudonocardia sp. EV170527-09 TaxID=2603411 RepID=UPI00351A07CA
MAPHSDPSGPAGPGGDTVTERTPAPEQEQSAARRANPGNRAADFGIDTTARTTREAITAYLRGLRGGDLGSLPALLGLAALFVLFSVLDSGGTFPSLLNLANLLQQGAGPTIIAMGLVFVLLTGEIDLAAGTASGLAAALMALHLMSDGNVLGATGTTVFVLLVAVMLAGAVLAALVRVWAGSVISLLTAVVLVIGVPANAFTVMGLAVGVGVVIGCLTGFLVARIGMPSFVVTLALFITWQGVILQLIGDGGTIALRDPLINAVANGNLSVTASWVLFVIVAGGYALVQTVRLRTRLRSGLVAPPTGLVALKIGAVVVLGGLVTFALVQDRSPGVISIAGVPYVVPIVLVLLVLGTWVLDRTRFGRHVYAVGGNREAARRAGIDVARIRASVFVISTAFAAIGAIVYSSKIGSVNPAAGGGNTLLFAVGAAVIGGTSLFGGRGRISNAVIGGTVLATVQNGLGLLKQPAAVVFVVTGLVLLLAAGVDVASRRRAAATGR